MRINRCITAIGLAAILLIGILCTSITELQAQPPSTIEERLANITKQEKEILQNLFSLKQEIELMELEEIKLAKEIEAANMDIEKIEANIAIEEANFLKRQEALKKVLQIYQRMGPASYLEIIMDSDSLSTMLRRMNILRDLTRNTGTLLETLNQSKKKLAAEKQKISETLELIKKKQEQSKEALANKLKLKQQQEDFLYSLQAESSFYREQLANMEKLIEDMKPMLAELTKEFSSIIADKNLPTDALKISISLFGVKGTIYEDTFNEITSKKATLSKLKFYFETDKVRIDMPERKLELAGGFVVQDGSTLRFRADEGSFYGMPLEPDYIKELFGQEELKLDLKPLLGKNQLQSIQIKDGYLEMVIKINLF